jgi:hypothetical protein
MASIRKETLLDIDAARAWSALSDFGNAGRLFAGVLVDCQRSGDRRTVTFANGAKIDERLVSVDEANRRIVYTVLNGGFSQHSASMQILKREAQCVFVWISDFLPDEAAARVEPLMEAGCQALKQNLAAL